MLLEKQVYIPEDWVPVTPYGSDLEEVAIVLGKVVAVGETIHEVKNPKNPEINCAYFFYVFLQGQRPIRLSAETREKALIRLKEFKRTLKEAKGS